MCHQTHLVENKLPMMLWGRVCGWSGSICWRRMNTNFIFQRPPVIGSLIKNTFQTIIADGLCAKIPGEQRSRSERQARRRRRRRRRRSLNLSSRRPREYAQMSRCSTFGCHPEVSECATCGRRGGLDELL